MHSAPRRGLLVIGVLKLLKGSGLLAIGAGLLTLRGDAASVVHHWIELLRFDVHARLVAELLGRVSKLDPRTAYEAGAGALLYGAVFCVEGVGLLLRKAWAEYLTTLVTASFLPLEAYELAKHPSVLKAVVISVNIVIAIYLLREIRRRSRAERAP